MKIDCLTTFLDGPRRFEKDDQVTVEDADGQRFCEAGWAKKVGDEVPASPATGGSETSLDIKNVSHKTSSEVGNG